MWVWDAFLELSTCRIVGHGGAGPIPWSVIHDYAKAQGVADEHGFRRVVRMMDAAFLEASDG